MNLVGCQSGDAGGESIVTSSATLPATPQPIVDALLEGQNLIMPVEDVEIPTEHVIHGGMYARTIRMPAGTVLIGALIKVPTMLVVNGHAKVFVGEGWTELIGYNVFPASAGRKQLFVSVSNVEITMIFPTKAKTVEECEREFTDEYELLMSNRQDSNTVTITGE